MTRVNETLTQKERGADFAFAGSHAPLCECS
jgi:hypothetical protein